MYEIVKQLIFWCEVQSVTLISSLNMVASAGALLQTYPVSTGYLKSLFTLLLSYLIAQRSLRLLTSSF